MFTGEFHHSIDDKGRLIIPSKYRNELGEKFVLTRGIEHCLYVYSLDSWNDITKKLDSLPFTKKDARVFIRSFFSAAASCNLDRQGRINITSQQAIHANITKECVIIGTGDRLEIWAKESWDNFFNSTKDNMSDIAENLFNESVNL